MRLSDCAPILIMRPSESQKTDEIHPDRFFCNFVITSLFSGNIWENTPQKTSLLRSPIPGLSVDRWMNVVEIKSALLTQLMDEHGDRLVLYAQQWCRAPEDVVQEAFVRLMRQRPVPENLVGWLYRVVRNGAISASRTEASRVRNETKAVNEAWWVAPTGGERLDADAAVVALQALPIDQRETIVLRLWSGLTYVQIAELTGSSTSTVHRCYVAGLKALRTNMNLSQLNRENPKL